MTVFSCGKYAVPLIKFTDLFSHFVVYEHYIYTNPAQLNGRI